MSHGKIRFAGLLVIAALAIGCGSTTDSAKVRQHGLRREVKISALPVEVNSDLVHLADAAAFSAAVYADVPLATTLAEAKRTGSDAQKAALTLLPDSGWIERTDIPRPQLKDTRQTPDLTYRLFISDEPQPKLAFLVFRGTHIRADWISNLRWIDFWLPLEDHYEQTARITEEVVHWIRKEYGSSIEILSTGHSLGGGLAQTAAYASCGEIATVFAFDSSPVTKHRARNVCGNATPKAFYRVFEQSEILSYARFGVRLLLGLKDEKPKMTEIKVHVFGGVAIAGHNMQKLALKLNRELTR
jgi:hypothetical protein